MLLMCLCTEGIRIQTELPLYLSCFAPGPAEDSYSLPPLPAGTMTRVRDFIADLARASKGYLKIKETVEAAYGDKALKKTAIYAIISKVKKGEMMEDQRHLNSKKP
jgi:hypothetical protein